MPFWSDRAYAARCAQEGWSEYTPETIELFTFMLRFLNGMDRDERLVGTNWSGAMVGMESEPLQLFDQLIAAMPEGLAEELQAENARLAEAIKTNPREPIRPNSRFLRESAS